MDSPEMFLAGRTVCPAYGKTPRRILALCGLGCLLVILLGACVPVGGRVQGARPEEMKTGRTMVLPPAELFFRQPEKKAFSISPDGTHVAWLASWNGRTNLYVAAVLPPASLTSQSSVHKPAPTLETARRITSLPNQDISSYSWAGDDEIVFLADVGEDGSTNIFSVPRAGGVIRDLTLYAGIRVKMVEATPSRPDEILVAMNQRDPALFDVYRLAVRTGQTRKVAENPGNVVQWTADHEGNLRAAVQTDGLRTVILYRDRETDPFRAVFSADAHTSVHLHGFAFDNRRLLLVTNMGRDRDALISFDPETETESRLIYAHPEVDVLAPLISVHRHSIEGVLYITDRVRYAFFSDARRSLQNAIDRYFPGAQATVVDQSRNERRLLILMSGDRWPGSYYLYDVPGDHMEKLADLQPRLAPDTLSAVRPIEYIARDGTVIHGYLTGFGGKSSKGMPVVVLPHADPWTRDVWRYDPEAQFLASRGYAVFQPNFRGSSGYGRAFQEAGFRQWGIGVMQDDVSDGVKWLVAQGIADPKRVGIYGVSYGGYAALAGLTFTPDLYAAGVSHSGPVNLFSLIQSVPLYRKVDLEKIYMEIGNPREEPPRLIAASPFFHVNQIRAPLLVAQGAVDSRVRKAELDAFVDGVRRRGIPVAYMVKPNEGHVFRNPENRMAFYRAMESFLARYLGGLSRTSDGVLESLEKTIGDR